MAAEIGVIMEQIGKPIKQWVCPHCGYIAFTSVYETESPQCPACIGSNKVYTWNQKENGIEVKEIFT